MSLNVQPPFPIFFDKDGTPLENGYIWIGTANLPPQTNPISVFWDSALTQPASQPIRTINGYPSNSGSPGALYVAAACSILVQDKNSNFVYTIAQVEIGVIGAGDITSSMLASGAVTTAKIADGAVTSLKMADGAGTLAKLDRNGLIGQVLTGQGVGVAPIWSAGLNTTRIDVASSGTVNLTSAAPNSRNINITGSNTITAFTVDAGLTYFVRFTGSLTLTNSASLVTQTGSNIVTQAGDTCILRSTASNVVEVMSYVPSKNSSQPGTAPVYGARAWVNFNGTGVVSINASGNVTSITDNGVGDYTVNFTNAMHDANYISVFGALGSTLTNITGGMVVVAGASNVPATKTTTQLRIQSGSSSTGALADNAEIYVAIFR